MRARMQSASHCLAAYSVGQADLVMASYGTSKRDVEASRQLHVMELCCCTVCEICKA